MYTADQLLDSDDLRTLRQLEEDLWRAETRFDNELMDRAFAPDFFEFGRSGWVYSRAEMLFEPGSHTTIDAVLPLPDFRARHLSEDVVQGTYVSEVTYVGKTLRANRSSIWSRTVDGWELRFHQGTPI